MACGRRGVTCGDGEGDALGQLDDAEGEDGHIEGEKRQVSEESHRWASVWSGP